MWRREKGLEYWLNKTPRTADNTPKGKIKEVLRGKLRTWSLNKSIQDCSLDIRCRTDNLDGIFDVSVEIKNGLGSIGPLMIRPDRKGLDSVEAVIPVHKADLMERAQVWPLKFPDPSHVQVRQALLTIIPYCRQFRINLGQVPVHSPARVQLQPPRTGGSGTLIPGNPAVKSMMRQAVDWPILQKSVDMDLLSDSEKRSYLQEAEQRKGIPAKESELIAVFRRVPIEMISKLHFQDDEKAIVYGISSGLNRSRTRIYEVMVIRDGSKEIHLIPHSTKNRMVVLN